MTELLAAGGCWNANRFALNGAGAGVRNWIGAIETDQIFNNLEVLILAVDIDADDMNDATDATFKIQWRNFTASGAWTDLAATGEIKWATVSDLTDDGTVIAAEDSGGNSADCSGKGWGRRDGLEKEGANGFTRTIAQDAYEDFQWAIALDSADHANEDQYDFRLTQSDNTVIGTGLGKLRVITAGKIDGITKNEDRSAAVGSVQVTAYLSDEASPPKPTGGVVAQLVSNSSTGVYSLTALTSGAKYFLHFFKDDTADLSDGSPEITAVDA